MDLFTFSQAAADSMVLGDIFSTLNGMLTKATGVLQAVVIFCGVLAFVIGASAGRWKTGPVIMALVAGGLIVWGGIQGVPWLADQVGSTASGSAA